MNNIPIFKIHKLVGMNVDTIYVFSSEFKKYDSNTLKRTFNENPNDELEEIIQT